MNHELGQTTVFTPRDINDYHLTAPALRFRVTYTEMQIRVVTVLCSKDTGLVKSRPMAPPSGSFFLTESRPRGHNTKVAYTFGVCLNNYTKTAQYTKS